MTQTSPMSKSQRAYDWIRERIARQAFTPGYRLVLAPLAAELGMSVVPVREAIRQLEAEGLVTFEHNVGARVSMVDDAQYRQSMQLLGITDGDIRRARALNQRMADQLDDLDPRAFTGLNQQFHAVLFDRCPNPRMLELVRAEWVRLGHLRYSTFAFVPGRAQESVREHEDILRLIEVGAPADTIETAVRRHRCATLDAYTAHKGPSEAVDLPAS